MKFGIGKILMMSFILMGFFGFGKYSYAVDCAGRVGYSCTNEPGCKLENNGCVSTSASSGSNFVTIVCMSLTVSQCALNSNCTVFDARCVDRTSTPPSQTQVVTKFCLCSKDNSQCFPTKYLPLSACQAELGNEQAVDYKCVPLPNADSKECDSLAKATTNNSQSTGGSTTGGSGTSAATPGSNAPAPVSGNSNSSYLGNLGPQIQELNKLKVTNIQGLIGGVINTLLGILGSIALAMVVYGGLLFMTAMGNAEKKKKSMGILVWAVLGIVIIFSSYAVVNFVLDILR